MPVAARDMNGYRDFERGHLRTSSYSKGVESSCPTCPTWDSLPADNGYDPYRRDREDYSPRRSLYAGDLPTNRSEVLPTARSEFFPSGHSDVFSARSYRDRDRGRHNGIEDYEHNSYDGGMRDGGMELSFVVDHLATYTSKSGTTRPEDGLTKLRQMESSTGIWTMRCTMILEKNHIVVVDKGNGEELERFPLNQVYDPTAVFKNDKKETYNNLILFTVVEDPHNRKCPSDMHIFQSVTEKANYVVDEILAAKGDLGGPRRGGYEQRIPPPPRDPAPEPPYAMGKSLKQSNRFIEPPFEDEPFGASLRDETRLRETRLRETQSGLRETRPDNTPLGESRFNDASQWINEYYNISPRQFTGQSGHYTMPHRGSDRSVKALGLDFPDYATPLPVRSISHSVESQRMGTGKAHGKAGNLYGTWSGRQLEKSMPKKGKKWYKFSFSKNSLRKAKPLGKENDAFAYSSSTLPLPKTIGNANYSSLRGQHQYKQAGDIGLRTQWSSGGGEWENHDEGGRFGVSGAGHRASYFHHTELDSGQNEALEKDVQLLNNCFDDIEKFVSRLQQAAEAYKELERRRMDRGNKRKHKIAGDGMLTMRARPPPGEDFVDIFQKFKFAFNLLAKLKAHIHDPNAPELVHFLFTPLSLIYEASRDPIHQSRDLSGEAVAPLLMFESKQLLLNCLTSKELELWQRLGKPWTLIKDKISPVLYEKLLSPSDKGPIKERDEWQGQVPYYSPRFYNGWQPSIHAEENGPSAGRLVETYRERDDYRRDDGPYRDFRSTERPAEYRPAEYRPSERDDFRGTRRDEVYTQEIRREDPYSRNDYRSPSPPPNRSAYSESKRAANTSIEKSRAEDNLAFAQELKRMGATIYEAVHDRQSKHTKELTVEKGDVFQVLDNSRNWWKLKNCYKEVGHAPYTILKEYQPRDEYNNGHGRRLSGDYSSYINGQAPPAPPPPGSSRGGRGESGREDKHPPKSPTERSKPDRDFRREEKSPPQVQPIRSKDKTKYSEDLHNELRLRMNTSGDSSGSPRSPGISKRHVNITQNSSPDDVTDWLESKGFSKRCIQLLRGYNGAEMFHLHREEFERLLGKDEGRHLDSLLMVQKNNSGYRKSGASELKAILERRKERMADDERFGARPSFMPETPPDYSPPASEASSDDFGDAGKTLRHLLERQRKKIQSDYYQQYD